MGFRDCWASREEAFIQWFNRESLVFVHVTREGRAPRNLHRLFRWWQRSGRLLID